MDLLSKIDNDELKDAFSARMKLFQDVIIAINDYVKKIDKALSASDYTKYTIVRSIIDNVLKPAGSQSVSDQSVSDQTVSDQTLSPNSKYYSIASEIFQVFESQSSQLSTIRSVALSESLAKIANDDMSELNSITTVIGVYDIEIANINVTIKSILLRLLNIAEHPLDALIYVLGHENTLDEFDMTIISTIYQLVPIGAQLQIAALLERQKDKILESPTISLLQNTNMVAIEQLVLRCNLTPVGVFLTWSELMGELSELTNGMIAADDVQMLADALETAIVIIPRNIGSPLQFDTRGLMSAKYIEDNDLGTNSTQGLNKKIIKRYNTVQVVPNDENASDAENASSATVVTPTQSTLNTPTHALVLDTCNSRWRILTNQHDAILSVLGGKRDKSYNKSYNKSNHTQHTKSQPHSRPHDKPQLPSKPVVWRVPLDTLTVGGFTARDARYHQIAGVQIVNASYMANQHIVGNWLETKKMSVPSDTVKNGLKIALINHYSEFNVRNDDEFREMIREDPSDIIMHKLLTQVIGEDGRANSESQLTYIAKFENITRDFRRTMETELNKITIPADTWQLGVKQLKAYISDIVDTLVRQVLREMERVGVFTMVEMSFKDYIMTYHNVQT